MSLLKTRLLLRTYQTITRRFVRHVQEFSQIKFDNSPPRDHVVILPELIDETSNSLLKICKNDSGIVDFSTIDVESGFKGLSQVLVQYENLLTDVNNGSLKFESFQELVNEIQNKTFYLDTAYNTILMLCHFNRDKLSYTEIFQLMQRTSDSKSEKFWDKMKETIQPYYDTTSHSLTPQQKKLINFYKILSPNPKLMQPDELYTIESYKTYIKQNVTTIHQNLKFANQLFSHTVDDPDVLAGVSEAFDDSVDQHHKRRTPLKITVDSYQKFMEVCPDRFIRHNLWKTLNKRCSPKAAPKLNNIPFIGNIRALRRSYANSMGYRNHLEYRLQNSSAESRQSILYSLDDINQKNRLLIKDRLEELEAFADDNGFSDPQKLGIREYDVDYWANKYIHDIIIGKPKSEVKTHFVLPTVLEGLISYFRNYMGVEIQLINDGFRTWDDEVKVYRFVKNGITIGNVIYDPYQRQDKQIPESAVGRIRSRNKSLNSNPIHFVSTFYKPGSDSRAAMLSLEDVVNLFYSFGDVTQKLFYNYDIYELNSYGGLEHDVENLFPNLVVLQLLEDHRILQSCSIREDGKPIDTDFCLRLLKAYTYFKCFRTWKDLYKAHLDVEVHSTLTDIKNIVSDIYPIYSPFERDPENFDYCAMSEILGGPYDGRQYSSLWSKLLARFCLSKFLSEGKVQELSQIDVTNIQASNKSLIQILYDPENFNSNQKLTSFVGRRFETTQSSLSVL